MTDIEPITQPRSVLSFSREYELATEPELAKRMGCARDEWLPTLVKELIDNALDAAEEAGIAPQITIKEQVGRRFTVADNGPGLSREQVVKLCDLSQRMSTREAFAAPDRGSQGNALPTLLALPFGFGLDTATTTIASQGLEHAITLRVDRLAQRIAVERTERPVATATGAAITMTWPDGIDLGEVVGIVYRHALLNRHARFQVIDAAGHERWSAGPFGLAPTKWMPGPIPPHWYTLERFAHRVLLEIRRDPEITVAQFLGTFRGLTDRSKVARVAAAAGVSYQRLSALLDQSGTQLDQDCAAALLEAMKGASRRAPKPDVLGAAGEVAFAVWVQNLAKSLGSNPDQSRSDGRPFFAYDTVDGVIVGTEIPYRWEVGICHLPGLRERALLVGQNFSPSCQPELMIEPVLAYVQPWPLHDPNQPIALFAHRITPARQALDYGKASLAIGDQEAIAVSNAIERIGKPWVKFAEAKHRGKTPILPGARPAERMTIKAAVEQVMLGGYLEATSNGRYPTTPRQLYYQVRPKVLELTGKTELGYGYFGADLLPHYLQDHPQLVKGWRLYFKARGSLREPHTNTLIPLGTDEVARYVGSWNGAGGGHLGITPPDWDPETRGARNRYSGLVVVEKDGIADLLIIAGVGERFDVAIVGNEGQSVEAELRLADALGIPTFALHDFDRTGLTICQNLRAGTWRHRYQNEFDVIEIGLRLDQVARLESEPISQKNFEFVGDDRLRECGATEGEIRFLGPRPGMPGWEHGRRVELNALTTEALVAIVESALTEHGIAKVVPAAVDLTAAWRSAQAHAEVAQVIEQANEAAAERWQDAEPPPDLADRIRKALEADPSLPWDAALRQIIEGS